jgi:hypothetical protein
MIKMIRSNLVNYSDVKLNKKTSGEILGVQVIPMPTAHNLSPHVLMNVKDP